MRPMQKRCDEVEDVVGNGEAHPKEQSEEEVVHVLLHVSSSSWILDLYFVIGIDP